MKFHITITNNETGETLHDADTCAIIAGVNEGEESGCIVMVDCGPIALAETLEAAKTAAKTAVHTATDKHPEIKALAELLRLLDKREQAESIETEEPKNEE
ncbi:MAG: hypothetical protein J6J61_06405 [Muribaculaceae bacterium]|nr:hypothetical protein [Muribaculaceae bacterium]